MSDQIKEDVIELIEQRIKEATKEAKSYPSMIILTLPTYLILKDELGISLKELSFYKSCEVLITNVDDGEPIRFIH